MLLLELTNIMDTGVLNSLPFATKDRIGANINDYFLRLVSIKQWHHVGIVD